MKKAESPARWYHAWQTPRAPEDDDAADMGTAFGLDMSIPDDIAEPLPAVAARRRDNGLMARWNNRRKTAS
jgi:hypothetical protein